MQTLLEFPNDLDKEYRDFIQDCAKLMTVSIMFFFLYQTVYAGTKAMKITEKNFTEFVSFIILGLAAYHLVLRKLINI